MNINPLNRQQLAIQSVKEHYEPRLMEEEAQTFTRARNDALNALETLKTAISFLNPEEFFNNSELRKADSEFFDECLKKGIPVI